MTEQPTPTCAKCGAGRNNAEHPYDHSFVPAPSKDDDSLCPPHQWGNPEYGESACLICGTEPTPAEAAVPSPSVEDHIFPDGVPIEWRGRGSNPWASI